MITAVFDHHIGNAAEILQLGGLVAVPTETVYGLAANGLDASAVEKIYAVKGRPPVKPLSLMVPGAGSLGEYASEVPQAATVLAEAFWPGPLTIVLKAKKGIPPVVLAGGDTVGLRCPDNALTLQALREAGIPFAAPSANRSGEKSPTNAQEVLDVFDGVIDAVIDGGTCSFGKESTIIDLSGKPYRILRQGALPEQDIADVLVKAMKVIGVTGMTGSGKTTALETLREYGAFVLDCDAVYHDLLNRSEEMKAELSVRFPAAFTGGALDRKVLGSIVFNDENELKALNAITHRFVAEEVCSRLRSFAMEGGGIAAIDAVELISSSLFRMCCCTIGIIAPEEQRLRRIMERDKISEEAARLRMKAQKSEEYYRENCTFTVTNDATPEELKMKIENILDKGC